MDNKLLALLSVVGGAVQLNFAFYNASLPTCREGKLLFGLFTTIPVSSHVTALDRVSVLDEARDNNIDHLLKCTMHVT